jgi:hypothetical protein
MPHSSSLLIFFGARRFQVAAMLCAQRSSSLRRHVARPHFLRVGLRRGSGSRFQGSPARVRMLSNPTPIPVSIL